MVPAVGMLLCLSTQKIVESCAFLFISWLHVKYRGLR